MSDGDHSIGYDADEYARVKYQPWRLWVELWSIFAAVRSTGIPLDGARVGDFGSGTGLYTRKLIDMGAGSVLAIDGDRDMIRRAREDSGEYNALVDYDDSWVQNTVGAGDCALIIGSWLMSYARTPEETLAYCRAIAGHLAKGGAFISFNNNPFERSGGSQYSPYGFTKTHEADEVGDYDGARVNWDFVGMTELVRNYNIMPETYEWTFREAGMSFTWGEAQLHPAQKGNPYWDCFFDGQAPANLMVAVRK